MLVKLYFFVAFRQSLANLQCVVRGLVFYKDHLSTFFLLQGRFYRTFHILFCIIDGNNN
jgi:hypothetical protein